MPAAAGGAAAEVDVLGRRYAIGIRVVTLVPTAVVALLAADGPAARSLTAVAVVVLAAWSTVYVVRLHRRRTVAVSLVDGVVLCCFASSDHADRDRDRGSGAVHGWPWATGR